MVIRSCAPLCCSLVPILGIEVWGVGLSVMTMRGKYDNVFGVRVQMFEEDEGIE